MISLYILAFALIIRVVVKGQQPIVGRTIKGETMMSKKLLVRDSSMAAVSSHYDYLSSSPRAFLLPGGKDESA